MKTNVLLLDRRDIIETSLDKRVEKLGLSDFNIPILLDLTYIYDAIYFVHNNVKLRCFKNRESGITY